MVFLAGKAAGDGSIVTAPTIFIFQEVSLFLWRVRLGEVSVYSALAALDGTAVG